MVAVLALLGNLLVIWTVWINSHMHTVTNYYIVNLAVSDLLVAAIVMPLKLLEYTAPCRWHIFRSDGLCSVVYYLLPVFVFASVLTLAAISIERYYAIVHPLSAMKVNSKSRTKKILAVTWILPFIVAGPFMFSTSYPFTIYSDTGSISRETCNDRFDEIDLAIHGDTTRIGRQDGDCDRFNVHRFLDTVLSGERHQSAANTQLPTRVQFYIHHARNSLLRLYKQLPESNNLHCNEPEIQKEFQKHFKKIMVLLSFCAIGK
ncbi:hypothetical protein DPMN_098768 [Dreissena polymorpha]|uniref:G-protein coupled receptors family 1 profile domain-containing protein n=1 Tax=Dreissena polymorpha TaxID=45954 RepID=A0A9D4R7L0_DREPO|nr:hypothetical protein DPMN_098768 [Dreissena polymorpha]